MKKYAMIVAAVMASVSSMAQETYENARLQEDDLNGTARYVGMAGAMDALGADISTIGSNPAGVGLFRHSTVSTSFGLVSQQDANDFRTGNKTNLSFDQIGIIFATRYNSESYVNFGFNFHKSKNFDYILSAAGALDGNSSQNGLSYIKGIGENRTDGTSGYNYSKSDRKGTAYWTSQLDNLYYNAYIIDRGTQDPWWAAASGYDFIRANTGYIGEYDFNISGNINNRVYLGLTVGIHDVHYHGVSEYTEQIVNANNVPSGTLTVSDDRRITGTGYDVKVGAIFRPIEESPFRFGLSIASPTFYKLTTSNTTWLQDNTPLMNAIYPGYTASGSYEFKMNTPWKFGLSLGHTVGSMVALGAVVEYADYGTIDTREITGEYYDSYYDTWQTSSASDRSMNTHTQQTLKGVATVKVGAEVKPDPNFAVRFGYNYVSPMYKTIGMKDGFIDSYGSNCSSATDYTNWKETHRLTCGIGARFDKFSLDLAYQYSVRNGDFYPFQDVQDARGDYNYLDNGVVKTEQIDITATPTTVSNKRHQILVTLGYTF